MKSLLLLALVSFSASAFAADEARDWNCEGLLANPRVHTVRKVTAKFSTTHRSNQPQPAEITFEHGRITLTGTVTAVPGGYGIAVSSPNHQVGFTGFLSSANAGDNAYAPAFILESTSTGMTGILTCEK